MEKTLNYALSSCGFQACFIWWYLFLNHTCYYIPPFGPESARNFLSHSETNHRPKRYDFLALMTEKRFYWIETELSRTHNHSFRSVIKDLMSSCDIPWPQEVPQLVKSYDHTASIFRKESGKGDWCGGLELIFSLTCHCVSCEVITSGVYFGVSPTVCIMIMFYCVIVLYDHV